MNDLNDVNIGAASEPLVVNSGRGQKMTKRHLLIDGLLILLVTASFVGGFIFGHTKKSSAGQLLAYNDTVATSTSDTFDFNVYSEVWNSLKTNFVDKNKLTNKQMFYGSLRGLAASTGDPYTVFMDPTESQQFAEEMAGTFEGIGAELGMKNDTLTVIAPLADMPAAKAGLQAGDKIYAIDGKSALGLSVDEAVKAIRGPKGTTVTLTIIRGGENKPRDIKITRDVIITHSVKTTMRPDGVYILTVTNFNDDTAGLFAQAVKDIVAKKPKGIVLDLRNNPGGYLDTAVSMVSAWVPAGPVVVEQYADGRQVEYPANGQDALVGYKTVVLINGGSASASEITAGALRDYKKATIMGEQSFGKGSVQTLQTLSDGSTLKVTIAKWLTPAGDFINEKGITPQIKVALTQADFDAGRDPQLQQAINFILKPATPVKAPIKAVVPPKKK
jgi:carboxyl-terminal processing protease